MSEELSLENEHYLHNEYYRHKDGGIYYTLYRGYDSRDRSPVVIYRHVYPFDPAMWVRPLSEWTSDRFALMTKAEAHDHVTKSDVDIERAKVTAARTSRKG